jgi:hypothetical protein
MKQMKFDFSELPLKNRAFSEKPMTFGNAEPKSFLKARENWQKAQLRNLIKHAHERSPFWRKRREKQTTWNCPICRFSPGTKSLNRSRAKVPCSARATDLECR